MTNAKKYCRAEYLVDEEDREIAKKYAEDWIDKHCENAKAKRDANPERYF